VATFWFVGLKPDEDRVVESSSSSSESNNIVRTPAYCSISVLLYVPVTNSAAGWRAARREGERPPLAREPGCRKKSKEVS